MDDIVSVAVGTVDAAPAAMAVRAAQSAVDRSGHRRGDVRLLLHATTTFQGVEGWSAAAYIQHRVLSPAAVAVQIDQGCNGSVSGLELAASYLSCVPGGGSALITAADSYAGSDTVRWRLSSGVVMADGAAGLALSTRRGFGRLLSTTTVTDPELEGLYRGDEPFRSALDPQRFHGSLDDRVKQFSARVAVREVTRRAQAGITAATEAALDDAGVTRTDIVWWLTPHVGRAIMRMYIAGLGTNLGATSWMWGRTVGHIGAGDQFTALDHLMTAGHLRSGDHVLIMGSSGWCWSCAVIGLV